MALKENLLHLFFLAYVHFNLGMFQTVIGITLTDLQCLFHSDLREVSYLFLAAGLPMMVASVLSIYLLRKMNLYLLLALTLLVYGLSISTVAGTRFIEVGFTALALCGFLMGICIITTYYLCNLLFPESGYAIHILTVALSGGNVLCPITAQPFIGKRQWTGNCTTSSCFKNMSISIEEIPRERSFANSINEKGHTENSSYCQTFISSVFCLYLILGLMSLPGVLFFCVKFVKSRDNVHSKANEYTELEHNRSKIVSVHVFVTLLLASIPCPFGLAYAFGSYLVTLGVTGPLHLGVQRMAFLASAFWFTFLAGRLTATALSICTRQVIILYTCFIGQIISFAIILLTYGKTELLLWTGSLLLAFFIGPTFGALMDWSRGYVVWTPSVLGMMTLADCVGMTLLPYVSGQVISLQGQTSYIYYCLGLAILEFLLFCALHLLSRYMGEVNNTSPTQNVISKPQSQQEK